MDSEIDLISSKLDSTLLLCNNSKAVFAKEDINKRIKNEICYDIIAKLSDENLMDEYKSCKSVQNEISKLDMVLSKNLICEEIKQKIIEDYILELIPPGAKGFIRGNKFNKIVQKVIEDLQLNPDNFEICFEKKCDLYLTTEIPDWYILEKSTNKILIGMNQLDLFGGGQQINRGFKYLKDNIHNTQNSKLLCVVCNDIEFKRVKNKAFELFQIGFQNDTLCYIKNLKNIIFTYFNLNQTTD